MERAATFVRTANTHVLSSAASATARCPRQTATPVGSIAHLPSANNVIHCTAGIAHIGFTFSEGQFINRVEDPYMVTGKVHRAPRDFVVDCVVVAIVVV